MVGCCFVLLCFHLGTYIYFLFSRQNLHIIKVCLWWKCVYYNLSQACAEKNANMMTYPGQILNYLAFCSSCSDWTLQLWLLQPQRHWIVLLQETKNIKFQTIKKKNQERTKTTYRWGKVTEERGKEVKVVSYVSKSPIFAAEWYSRCHSAQSWVTMLQLFPCIQAHTTYSAFFLYSNEGSNKYRVVHRKFTVNCMLLN